jgi:hypothetical protein
MPMPTQPMDENPLGEHDALFNAEFKKLPAGHYKAALLKTFNTVSWCSFYFDCRKIPHTAADIVALAKLIVEEAWRKSEQG